MSNLNKALDDLKFDTRMIDYNLKNNLIKDSDVEASLSQLPDLQDKVQKLMMEEEEGSSTETEVTEEPVAADTTPSEPTGFSY